MAHDYVHEKYVRLVRDNTGKISCRGLEARLELAALCGMKNVDSFRPKRMQELLRHQGQLPEQWGNLLKFSENPKLLKVYQGVSKLLDHRQVFSKVMRRETINRWDPVPDSLHSSRTSGVKLDAHVPHAVSTGLARASQYYSRYYIESQGETSRSNKEVNLQCISQTVEQAKVTKQATIDLVQSRTPLKLMKFTKRQLIAEHNKLKQKAGLSDEDHPPLSEDALLSDIAETLCKLRVQQFKANKTWAGEMTREALQSQGKITTAENRAEELSQEFYSFKNCTEAWDKSYAKTVYHW